MKLKFVKLAMGKEMGLPLPAYQSDGASGMDLYAAIDKPIVIGPGKTEIIPNGVSVEIPEGYEGQIRGRSGLAFKHGVCTLGGVGTVDNDYRGPLNTCLYNASGLTFNVMPGDRIAQLVICRVERVTVVEVDELSETARGEGGMGSTGR